MPTPNDILGLPSGAQWLKADLHVHTPASKDFNDNGGPATPEDVVGVAIEKGLDIIGITDHNTAKWCDRVRKAAESKKLVVFPGVEISTPQGHVLALFDSSVCSSHIHDLLVKVGISRNEFGSQNVVTKQGIEDVLVSISEDGGVAIAAHADGPRGFLETIPTGAERKRVYCARYLWAMEILDTTSRKDHQSKTHDRPRRMTCLQFSDSHQLDDIARRYSLLKMDEKSISGLKMALIDPDIRVQLPEDESPSPECIILGMWVTRGFLDGQMMRFNENVNCFIGDTGSGKSVSIELIRFALNQQPVVPKILKEVESLLEKQLGALGMVHVLLAKGDSIYLVERTWNPTPQPPLVQRVTEGGQQPVDGLDTRRFFPIKCFSQSEIIEFAREPDVRLSLTDDLIDCSAELSTIIDVKSSLRENAAAIIAEQVKEANICTELERRPALNEEIARIDSILTHSQIAQQQLWYTEQEVLNHTNKLVNELSDVLPNATSQLILPPPWPDNIGTLPNHDLLEKARNAYQDWQDHVAGIQSEAKDRLLALIKSFASLRKEWNTRFEKSEAEYHQLLGELDKDGIGLQALSNGRKSIQAQITKLDDMSKELQEHILPRLQSLNEERERLLDKLQENRKSITRKRKEKAKSLSSQLNHDVLLKVHTHGSTSGFKQALREIATGARLQGPELDCLATHCHPVPFVKKLLTEDFENLSKQTGLNQLKLAKLRDTIEERNRLEDLYKLQLIDVEDFIEVKLKVDGGNYRCLEDLSHGQKCRVVLMVALAEGDSPLLVDQPEDALHAPGIEEGIVASLRSGRGGRQCIFATRNANILVSADAEQIIALKATSQRGRVDGAGSLDRFDHRQLIIYHVEGGEEAFQRRKTMYTLEPSI